MSGVRKAAPSSSQAPLLPISFAARWKIIVFLLRRRPTARLFLPQILTRSGWYDAMHARLPSPPRRLTDLEREVLLNAASREVAASDVEPPFRLRPGLLVEMLALYDDLRRRDSSVDGFERVLVRELQRDADDDRGAARLLKQTTFLAAAFRVYEARRDTTGAVDEYTLRTKLLETIPTRPLRHIVVTVGERSVDPAGLWPADLALLTQLPLLEQIDIVATHATIAAGLLDRLEKFMPGFEEGELPSDPDEAERHVDATGTGRAVGNAVVYGESRPRRRVVVGRSGREDRRFIRPRSSRGGVQAPPAVRLSRERRVRGCRRSVSDIRRSAAGGGAVCRRTRSRVRVRHVELHARARGRTARIAALFVRDRRCPAATVGRRSLEPRAQR